MKYRLISQILGIGLIIFSFFQLLPVLVAFLYQEDSVVSFIYAFLITLVSGLCLVGVNLKREYEDLRIRDGFLLTVLLWFTYSIFASLPFVIGESSNLTIAVSYTHLTLPTTTSV